MTTPVVTVLMPVYNAGRYLAEAVSSILAQTFKDFEFVIVDDGSTDRSKRILERFAQQDWRIKLISRPNTGIVGALNDGIAGSRGELIARMDADDVSHLMRLERQVKFMNENPDCVAAGSRVVGIDPYGCELFRSEQKLHHDQIDAELLNGVGWAIVHPSAMIRRSAIDAIGGYHAEFQWVEDLDLFLRLAEHGRLANLPDLLLNYRQHTESVNRMRAGEQAKLADTCVRAAYHRRGLEVPAGWTFTAKPKPAKDAQLRTWAWKALGAGNFKAARKHAVALWRTAPFAKDSWRTLLCAMRGY